MNRIQYPQFYWFLATIATKLGIRYCCHHLHHRLRGVRSLDYFESGPIIALIEFARRKTASHWWHLTLGGCALGLGLEEKFHLGENLIILDPTLAPLAIQISYPLDAVPRNYFHFVLQHVPQRIAPAKIIALAPLDVWHLANTSYTQLKPSFSFSLDPWPTHDSLQFRVCHILHGIF